MQGTRFEPWSGKIPHAAGQVGLCTTTAEPERPGASAPQQEKPLQWEAHFMRSNRDPVQKIKKERKKKKKKNHSECLSLWAYPESHQDFKRPSKAGLWKKAGLPGKGLPGNRHVSWQTWVFTKEGQGKWEVEENGAPRRNGEWERQAEKTGRSQGKLSINSIYEKHKACLICVPSTTPGHLKIRLANLFCFQYLSLPPSKCCSLFFLLGGNAG